MFAHLKAINKQKITLEKGPEGSSLPQHLLNKCWLNLRLNCGVLSVGKLKNVFAYKSEHIYTRLLSTFSGLMGEYH